MEQYYLCGSCKTKDPDHHLPGCPNASVHVDTSGYLYPMEEDRRTRGEHREQVKGGANQWLKRPHKNN